LWDSSNVLSMIAGEYVFGLVIDDL